MVNLDWFIKKLGIVFKLQDANLRMSKLGIEDKSTFGPFPSIDKLLYERYKLVKVLSSKSLSH
jgi:hypothetical protein